MCTTNGTGMPHLHPNFFFFYYVPNLRFLFYFYDTPGALIALDEEGPREKRRNIIITCSNE